MNGLATVYLSDRLKLYARSYMKRSTATNWLYTFHQQNRSLGVRAFGTAAPSLWNRLPVQMGMITDMTKCKRH